MRMCFGAIALSTLFTAGAHAQVLSLLEDNFDDGLESWWILEDLHPDSSPFEWTTNETLQRNGGFGDTYQNYTDGDGLAATASSDAAPGNYDVAMMTPVIRLPSDPTGLELTYESNYQNFQNSDRAHTDISTNGGQSWTSLLQWNEDHGALFGDAGTAQKVGESVAIDLAAYAGEEVQIRFRYFEPNGGSLSFYWQIDNFMISGVPTPGALASLAAGGLLAVRRRR